MKHRLPSLAKLLGGERPATWRRGRWHCQCSVYEVNRIWAVFCPFPVASWTKPVPREIEGFYWEDLLVSPLQALS
jgi:hypothetical protein